MVVLGRTICGPDSSAVLTTEYRSLRTSNGLSSPPCKSAIDQRIKIVAMVYPGRNISDVKKWHQYSACMQNEAENNHLLRAERRASTVMGVERRIGLICLGDC